MLLSVILALVFASAVKMSNAVAPANLKPGTAERRVLLLTNLIVFGMLLPLGNTNSSPLQCPRKNIFVETFWLLIGAAEGITIFVVLERRCVEPWEGGPISCRLIHRPPRGRRQEVALRPPPLGADDLSEGSS